jgi:hypothetical protein
MNQTLHILKKDIRRYWPEVLASLAAPCLFAWYTIRNSHRVETYLNLAMNRYLGGLITFLLPLTWWLLVVRVIQGESLVGDRQFWITRPYEWKKLLASKVILLLLFVNLPFLVMQVMLLHLGGFSATHYLKELVLLQAMPSLLILPVATLATVTSSFGRAALAGLLVIVYMSLTSFINSEIPSAGFSSDTDSLQFLLFLATCFSVVWLQYSLRSTTRSRWMIVGFGVVIWLILVATPYRILIARRYPSLAREASPINFNLVPPPQAKETDTTYRGDQVQINVPLEISRLQGGSIAEIRGALISIQGSKSTKWTSGWKGQYRTFFSPGKRTNLDFELPRKVFDRIRFDQVNIELSRAVVVGHETDHRSFVTPPGTFELTGLGRCAAGGDPLSGIQCRLPFRRPSALLVTADASLSTCPLTEKQERAKPGSMSNSLFWNLSGDDINFDFNPVESFDIYMSSDFETTENTASASICPGTPLTLSSPVFDRQFRVDLLLNSVRLDEYRYRYPRFMFSTGPRS